MFALRWAGADVRVVADVAIDAAAVGRKIAGALAVLALDRPR